MGPNGEVETRIGGGDVAGEAGMALQDRDGVAWEHFDHGADIGVRGYGASLSDAFANAAVGLTAVITDPMLVRSLGRVSIHCEAPQKEILFIDWLNALVFEMADRGMVFGRFEVRIADGSLSATAWGEPVDRQRHSPAVEVKGATMTELKVVRNEKGWMAQCVVDV